MNRLTTLYIHCIHHFAFSLQVGKLVLLHFDLFLLCLGDDDMDGLMNCIWTAGIGSGMGNGNVCFDRGNSVA
jgi:hypothetical protein